MNEVRPPRQFCALEGQVTHKNRLEIKFVKSKL